MVTGAASGIGEQLAKHLAVRGSNLHLIDRDEARLVAVADRIARDNPAVTVRVTVFDLEAIEHFPELAKDVIKGGFPTLLVNNAGVALGGQFQQLTLETEFTGLPGQFPRRRGVDPQPIAGLASLPRKPCCQRFQRVRAGDAAGSVGVRRQ